MTDDDLSTIAWDYDDGRIPNGGSSKKCAHPKWQRTYTSRVEWTCTCGYSPDPAKVRAGGNAKARGLALQRKYAAGMGLTNLQGNGPTDAQSQAVTGENDLFVAQMKSGTRFPGWMQDELDKLPTTGGRIPLLTIIETPGGGRRARALVVLTYDDWCALHVGSKP